MCDGGPYNGADSVHWSFIYIYIKELPIYEKESGCIPPGLGDTLLDSRFDFETHLTEGRKTPTPGSKSMVEGPTKVLRVFRALLCTYTMPNHHYTSTYMLAYHHLKS